MPTTPYGYVAPPGAIAPSPSGHITNHHDVISDALDRINRTKLYSMAANKVPVGPDAGAIVQAMINDISAAGGGALYGDLVGTVVLEQGLEFKTNTGLIVPVGTPMKWQAKAGSALPYMMQFDRDAGMHHFPGFLDANNTAVEGIRSLGAAHTFMFPRILNYTGYGYRAENYSQAVYHPQIVSGVAGSKGVGLGTNGLATGSGANDLRITSGSLSSAGSDVTVITGGGQNISGIGLDHVSINSPNISIDIPASSGLSDIALDNCRWEGGGTSTANRVVRCLDTNCFGIHVDGGSYFGPTVTKPDYLFEMDGGDHVVANAVLGNYNLYAIQGKSGTRRPNYGFGCQIVSDGTLYDNSLVSAANKPKATLWRQTSGSQPALLMGDGSAPNPTFGPASDPTTGMYFDPVNHRICFAIQGVLQGYLDPTAGWVTV